MKAQLIFLYFPIRTMCRRGDETKCHQYRGTLYIRIDILLKTKLFWLLCYFTDIHTATTITVFSNFSFSSNTADMFSRIIGKPQKLW